tara:strand:- start:3501 stop:4574 length:1074 start_codon:yes stop_codon:yes gene_type:complete
MNKSYLKIFKNKKIIITGHTGFKGSWLSLWLYLNGAKILGISDSLITKPSHFKLLNLQKKIISKNLDINDLKKLKRVFQTFKPDFVFHLAAQSIVKRSYLNPVKTWKTNLLGTLNVLECLRLQKKETIAIMITSDKAYKNIETKKGYIEKDSLGGSDPYGASKSSADICINSYIKSFFSGKKNKVYVTTARAGNVIGGGDWTEDRLIPDIIKSSNLNNPVLIRNLFATRPWQHVLDVLNGYLIASYKLKKNKRLHGQAFNFGPSSKKDITVKEVLSISKKLWPKIKWKFNKNKKNYIENTLLKLNSTKSKSILGWRSILTFKQTINLTINWYKKYYLKEKNVFKLSSNQIKNFERNI